MTNDPRLSSGGSGAAMSPFPHNPSLRFAADRPGLGLIPPELPLSVRCQFQSELFLPSFLGQTSLRDRDQDTVPAEIVRIFMVVSSANELRLTLLLV